MVLGDSTLAAVGFLHPSLALAGLACGLIPVLVHLMNRRRHIRVPWAAMSFLMAARRRSARRIWIEQLLLLVTRMVLLMLLGMALARPFVPASSRLGLASSGIHHVIVLDNSLSMQARGDDGVTRFDRARSYAEALVPDAESADAVSLVTMATPAVALIEDATSDLRFVRDQVTDMNVTQRASDVVGALRLAETILNASSFPPANRVVHILSDFPQSTWKGGKTPTESVVRERLERLATLLPDARADLRLVVVDPKIESNVSMTKLQIADPSRDQQGVPTLVGVRFPLRLLCEVKNHGTTSVDGLTLQMRIKPPRGGDGQILRRQPIPTILPGGTQTIVVTTSFAEPGIHLVQAELIDSQSQNGSTQDRMVLDNARYLSVDVRPQMPVLLVDGRPGLTPLQGQAGFLATALAPRTESGGLLLPFERRSSTPSALQDSLIQPKVITETELSSEVLTEYAAVMLCNVRRLPEQEWKRLELYAQDGGGVGVFCGDQLQVDHYNRYGFAQGKGLLPGTFSESRDASDATTGVARADLSFGLTQPPHPLLAEFEGRPESGLFLAKVERYLPMTLSAVGSEAVLTYSNADPALIVSPFGLGRVCVCTTTANMEWTNLPAKGDYVSLMVSVLAYLSPSPGGHRNIIAGDLIQEPLSAAQVSLPRRVLSGGQQGTMPEPELVPDGDAMLLSYGPIEEAGSVELAIGADTRLFAINVATSESELQGADASELTSSLKFPFRIDVLASGVSNAAFPNGDTHARSTELGSLTVYLVIVLLLLETTLAVRFGMQRAKKELRVTKARPAPPQPGHGSRLI